MMSKERFSEWLIEEIRTRAWSQNELARRASVTSSAVSQVITGRTAAGPDFCRGVARALDKPAEEVFRRAGLLPPATDETSRAKEALHLFEQLTTQRQDDLLAQMRALLQIERQRTSSPESRREEAA